MGIESSPDISQIRWVRKTVAALDLGAIGLTNGVLLVQERPGWYYMPIYFEIAKPAGTAFIVTEPANIAVGHLGVGGFLELPSVGLLDQSVATRLFRFAERFSPAPRNSTAASLDTYSGKALVLTFGSYEGDHTGLFEEKYLFGLIPGERQGGLFAFTGGEWERNHDATGDGHLADHTALWERTVLSPPALNLLSGSQVDVTVGFLQLPVIPADAGPGLS